MKAIPHWLRAYQKPWLSGDITAGMIVTVMLIPQSLAYAMLAGLPPETGLYASILPIVAYAVFGSSMTLAVGPVAVSSLMTASALGPLAASGSAEYTSLAIQLSLLSGLMLVVLSALKFGFLARFLSHPVISGFISGSAVLIAVSQLKHLLGVKAQGETVVDTLAGLVQALPQTKPVTLALGAGSLAFLLFSRRHLPRLLEAMGLPSKTAGTLAKLAPMLAVIVSTLIVAALRLDQHQGVSVVGAIPQGLPSLSLPMPSVAHLDALWLPALLISLVGFVESVSVAQSLALKRRQRIDPDGELLGLGAANVASAISGGFPVTGGFSRSVVNFSAGAQTPLAGVIAAGFMTIISVWLTGLFHYLPHAVLAATIIAAVLSLIDVHTLREVWVYDKTEALSLTATASGVVFLGVEAGILLGVALSLGTLVWRSSHPHIAVVGRVPGTEHFRNIERHKTQIEPGLIAVRVDESLFFANASVLLDKIEALADAEPDTRFVLLVCSAVNQIDATALGVLEDLERSLAERNISLILAEVKGPVMDRIQNTHFGHRIEGKVFLSVHDAFRYVAEHRQAAGTHLSNSPTRTEISA